MDVNLALKSKGPKSQCDSSTWADLKLGALMTSRYFDVMDLEQYDAILGMPWHEDFEPQIDWHRKIINIVLEDGRVVQLFSKTSRAEGLSSVEMESKEAQDREPVDQIDVFSW